MAASSQVRKEVMAEIITFYRAAQTRSEDAWRATEIAFPGIPSEVVAEAMLEVAEEETEAWWQTVERTIEGEVIRNALANPKS